MLEFCWSRLEVFMRQLVGISILSPVPVTITNLKVIVLNASDCLSWSDASDPYSGTPSLWPLISPYASMGGFSSPEAEALRYVFMPTGWTETSSR